MVHHQKNIPHRNNKPLLHLFWLCKKMLFKKFVKLFFNFGKNGEKISRISYYVYLFRLARINLLFCQISILWIRSNQSLASFSSSAAISSAEAKVPGPKFSRSNFSLRSLESRIDDGDLVKLLTGCVSAADDRKPLLLSFDASVTKKGQSIFFVKLNYSSYFFATISCILRKNSISRN